MFTEADRYKILNHLELSQSDLPLLWEKLNLTQAESETLVEQVIAIVTKMDLVAQAFLQAGTRQAGLEKADVLEWKSDARICQIKRYRNDLKRQLARFIGYEVESEVANIF
ncbi:MAG: hypothetical protein WBB28_27065 [Crinalium sp.]